MNTAMWDHPLTAQQLDALVSFGWRIIDPIAKQLACGDVGNGAMQEPSAIADAAGGAAHEYLMQHPKFPYNAQPAVRRVKLYSHTPTTAGSHLLGIPRPKYPFCKAPE